jgi:hypothetical protein
MPSTTVFSLHDQREGDVGTLDLLAVSKELIGLGTTLAKAQHERRLALADYLSKIADCIQKITQSFRARDTDALKMLCAELEVYGEDCGRILAEMLQHDKAEELSKRVAQATYTRRGVEPDFLLSNVFDPDSFLSDLRDLDEAVGHLRGTANTLRAPVVIFDRIPRRSSVKEWLMRLWPLHKS